MLLPNLLHCSISIFVNKLDDLCLFPWLKVSFFLVARSLSCFFSASIPIAQLNWIFILLICMAFRELSDWVDNIFCIHEWLFFSWVLREEHWRDSRWFVPGWSAVRYFIFWTLPLPINCPFVWRILATFLSVACFIANRLFLLCVYWVFIRIIPFSLIYHDASIYGFAALPQYFKCSYWYFLYANSEVNFIFMLYKRCFGWLFYFL